MTEYVLLNEKTNSGLILFHIDTKGPTKKQKMKKQILPTNSYGRTDHF